MEEYNNIESFFDYVRDRIYCNCESNGNPYTELAIIVEEFKKFIYKENYNINEDLDKDNNNVVHLIAKYNLHEFYDVKKQHPEFDNMKNQKNIFNFTPYDIVCSYTYILIYISAYVFNNQMSLIPILVTFDYRLKSNHKLLDVMPKDNFYNAFLCKKKNEYMVFFYEYALSKVNEKISDDNEKKFALIKNVMQNLPDSFFDNIKNDTIQNISEIKKIIDFINIFIRNKTIEYACHVYIKKIKLNFDSKNEK